nr:hypothetical protein [Tanacetum cinerariifolium]
EEPPRVVPPIEAALGQTINHNSDDYGHESNEDDNNNKKNDNKKNAKKRKRKPGGGIGNKTMKYFDPKWNNRITPCECLVVANCRSIDMHSKLGSYITKSIYMDDLEDILKDEDVIKEIQEALDKLKGDNGNGKGISLD